MIRPAIRTVHRIIIRSYNRGESVIFGALHVQRTFKVSDMAKNVRAHGASVEMNKFPCPASSNICVTVYPLTAKVQCRLARLGKCVRTCGPNPEEDRKNHN
jgi:hypothetical protein